MNGDKGPGQMQGLMMHGSQAAASGGPHTLLEFGLPLIRGKQAPLDHGRNLFMNLGRP